MVTAPQHQQLHAEQSLMVTAAAAAAQAAICSPITDGDSSCCYKLTRAMALHGEPLGGEGVIGVGLCRGVLHASISHALACEGISIHQVEGAAIEADVVPHGKVTGGEEAAVCLLDAMTPDQDSLPHMCQVGTIQELHV